MKMNNVIFKLLNNLEKIYINNSKRYGFFFIYYYCLELICKRYFDRLIFETLLVQDNIVEFLEVNEFGYKQSLFNRFLYKKDIIDENSFYGELNNIDVSKTIKADFEDALLEEIKKSNIVIDVENYINVFVEITKDDMKNIRIYSIYVRYYRNYVIQEHKTRFKKLFYKILIILGLVILGYYIFKLIPNLSDILLLKK